MPVIERASENSVLNPNPCAAAASLLAQSLSSCVYNDVGSIVSENIGTRFARSRIVAFQLSISDCASATLPLARFSTSCAMLPKDILSLPLVSFAAIVFAASNILSDAVLIFSAAVAVTSADCAFFSAVSLFVCAFCCSSVSSFSFGARLVFLPFTSYWSYAFAAFSSISRVSPGMAAMTSLYMSSVIFTT